MPGLSQRQLCEHFGWDYRIIARTAKAQGLSTHAYLQQKTGWILKQERYYPISQSKIPPKINHESFKEQSL